MLRRIELKSAWSLLGTSSNNLYILKSPISLFYGQEPKKLEIRSGFILQVSQIKNLLSSKKQIWII